MSSSLKFNQANPKLYHTLQLSLLHLDAVAAYQPPAWLKTGLNS